MVLNGLTDSALFTVAQQILTHGISICNGLVCFVLLAEASFELMFVLTLPLLF